MWYLQNYKEFVAEILDLQLEKYGLSFDIKKYTTSSWALGDENVISIRVFKYASLLLTLKLNACNCIQDSGKYEIKMSMCIFTEGKT